MRFYHWTSLRRLRYCGAVHNVSERWRARRISTIQVRDSIGRWRLCRNIGSKTRNGICTNRSRPIPLSWPVTSGWAWRLWPERLQEANAPFDWFAKTVPSPVADWTRPRQYIAWAGTAKKSGCASPVGRRWREYGWGLETLLSMSSRRARGQILYSDSPPWKRTGARLARLDKLKLIPLTRGAALSFAVAKSKFHAAGEPMALPSV